MVHLDRRHLVGSIEIQLDSRRDFLWFDGSGVIQKAIEGVGIFVPEFLVVILSQNYANQRSPL